jgi:tRNA (guanine-N7-)-methyltransferase
MRTAGMLIENLKNGLTLPFRHENPYLSEALTYENELFTKSQIPEFVAQKIENQDLPVILEIGCYYGKTLEELARMNPQFNIVGIDITYKRVVKAARRVRLSSLQNAFSMLSFAEELFPALPEGKLQGICVFFPDPWPKKKQQKNRLLQLEFLREIHGKLKAGGFFWFKTDSLDYFEFVRQNLSLTEFVLNSAEIPAELNKSRYQTAFESLFETKGEPAYSLIVRKSDGREMVGIPT